MAESPQATRCGPSAQTSPGLLTGSDGGPGVLSGSPPPRGLGLVLLEERREVFLGPPGAREVVLERGQQLGEGAVVVRAEVGGPVGRQDDLPRPRVVGVHEDDVDLAPTWTAKAQLPGYTQLQPDLNLIQRAITLIDATSPNALAPFLAQTGAHAHIKASAAAFRAALADDSTAYALIGRRQIAQQLLRAAGLPFMAADYA